MVDWKEIAEIQDERIKDMQRLAQKLLLVSATLSLGLIILSIYVWLRH